MDLWYCNLYKLHVCVKLNKHSSEVGFEENWFNFGTHKVRKVKQAFLTVHTDEELINSACSLDKANSSPHEKTDFHIVQHNLRRIYYPYDDGYVIGS